MSPGGWPVEFSIVMWIIVYVTAKLALQALNYYNDSQLIGLAIYGFRLYSGRVYSVRVIFGSGHFGCGSFWVWINFGFRSVMDLSLIHI